MNLLPGAIQPLIYTPSSTLLGDNEIVATLTALDLNQQLFLVVDDLYYIDADLQDEFGIGYTCTAESESCSTTAYMNAVSQVLLTVQAGEKFYNQLRATVEVATSPISFTQLTPGSNVISGTGWQSMIEVNPNNEVVVLSLSAPDGVLGLWQIDGPFDVCDRM